MKGRNKFFMIVILGMLSAIGPFSIDMYLPGFPAIAADLQTTLARVTLSLSSFFIGISAGQLLYGPLLDRYGRKRPLYIGLSVYLLASIGCALCTSVNALIGLRLIQAIGGCAGMVAARAMVRDIFPVEENAKIFSMLMLVIGVSPIIAPTLGGYITAAFGWHYIFILLAVMSAFLLAAVHFALPESRKPDVTVSLLPAPIIKGFITVFKDPQFYTYAFTGAISAAGLYAYIAGSPHVFMELYKVTEREYGWIFAGIALGLITCSQLNSFLLRRFTSEQIIPVALVCQTLAGLMLVLGTAFHFLGLYSTIFFILIFLSTQGFVFPNSSALSMAPFSRNAGTASALMGAIQLAVGALTSSVVSILTNGTAMPMAGVMAACALLSLSVLLIGKKALRYQTTVIGVQEESAELISTS
jgi:DHA1 family bicyclomycin/chloramphenicol resistance-like MFS transporter